MSVGTSNTQAVKRGDAHRARKIAVGATTGAAMRELDAQVPGYAARLFIKRHRAGIGFPHRPGHTTGDLEDDIVAAPGKREHPFDAAIEIGLSFGHAERLAAAGGGNAIDPLAAMHDADREGAIFGRHAVDSDNLACHLAESVAPAWLGLPMASRLKRAMAYRPVTTPLLRRPGSGTSTYLLRAASASMMSRVDGVPTSSSGVNSTVIGSGVVNAATASCRIASRVR